MAAAMHATSARPTSRHSSRPGDRPPPQLLDAEPRPSPPSSYSTPRPRAPPSAARRFHPSEAPRAPPRGAHSDRGERSAGSPRRMTSLLYGAGLRLVECAELRVKDLDLERREILVCDGKDRKDRITLLPLCLVPRSAITSPPCAPSTPPLSQPAERGSRSRSRTRPRGECIVPPVRCARGAARRAGAQGSSC
ncbi:tyrosine-type recombinase/integrase [Sorangium sp. So ce321]|uniref:tyrosine-type recombinase/integrase n=1 Tax=Sorangium sp. So ce321 TaxID=3133300 RepID=UPI003F618E26